MHDGHQREPDQCIMGHVCHVRGAHIGMFADPAQVNRLTGCLNPQATTAVGKTCQGMVACEGAGKATACGQLMMHGVHLHACCSTCTAAIMSPAGREQSGPIKLHAYLAVPHEHEVPLPAGH